MQGRSQTSLLRTASRPPDYSGSVSVSSPLAVPCYNGESRSRRSASSAPGSSGHVGSTGGRGRIRPALPCPNPGATGIPSRDLEARGVPLDRRVEDPRRVSGESVDACDDAIGSVRREVGRRALRVSTQAALLEQGRHGPTRCPWGVSDCQPVGATFEFPAC